MVVLLIVLLVELLLAANGKYVVNEGDIMSPSLTPGKSALIRIS